MNADMAKMRAVASFALRAIDGGMTDMIGGKAGRWARTAVAVRRPLSIPRRGGQSREERLVTVEGRPQPSLLHTILSLHPLHPHLPPSPACPHVSSDLIPTVLNFRDDGAHINNLTSQRLLQSGLLYRSVRPDAATAADQRRLRDELGIKPIPDLRTPTEHQEARKLCSTTAPSFRSASPPHGPPTPPS